MSEAGYVLPPGQRPIGFFPRVGPPRSVRWRPSAPPPIRLAVEGDVEVPCEITAEDLAALPRIEQESGLHCVATWSRLGIRWGGWRFRDLYESIIVPRAHPLAGAGWLCFRGLDGYASTLALDDALVDDVLIADSLDGKPLPLEHGLPLRLVAPTHYGYKSVKHLAVIEPRSTFQPQRIRFIGFVEHPRGRVAVEERGADSPGWAVSILRRFYQTPFLAILLRLFRRR